MAPKVLIVATSGAELAGNPTGVWSEGDGLMCN